MNNRVTVIILIFGLLAFALPMMYVEATLRNYRKAVDGLRIENVNLSGVRSGVYTGKCSLMLVSAEVEVEVRDSEIYSITILEHNNARGKRAEIIPLLVINEQSLRVDTITGATASSKVLLKAIEKALKKGLR